MTDKICNCPCETTDLVSWSIRKNVFGGSQDRRKIVTFVNVAFLMPSPFLSAGSCYGAGGKQLKSNFHNLLVSRISFSYFLLKTCLTNKWNFFFCSSQQIMTFLPLCWAVLSCSVVSDSATPWTVAGQASLSLAFSRQEHYSGLQVDYHLSHQESPRILEWVTYPFFRGPSENRNRVSCFAGGFLTS